jgi:hypothetical protein
LYSPYFGGGWLLEDSASPPELEEDEPEEELPLLEDCEPPPELEEEGLPLLLGRSRLRPYVLSVCSL